MFDGNVQKKPCQLILQTYSPNKNKKKTRKIHKKDHGTCSLYVIRNPTQFSQFSFSAYVCYVRYMPNIYVCASKVVYYNFIEMFKSQGHNPPAPYIMYGICTSIYTSKHLLDCQGMKECSIIVAQTVYDALKAEILKIFQYISPNTMQFMYSTFVIFK